MKEFLKKYLTEEQLKDLEDAYIKDHEGSKGLPVYISKSRLDEVLVKQHNAENERDALKTEIEKQKTDKAKEIEEAVKKAKEEAEQAKDTALKEQKRTFEISEEIYKAKGRNVVAIKALIDETKDVKAEIARLQKEANYLFESTSDDVPYGTGKKGAEESSDKQMEAMRRAVGLK